MIGDVQVNNIGAVLYRILFHGYVHLWYMWGLILVVPFIYWLIVKNIKPCIFIGIAVAAYVFNRVYTHYGSMENPGWMWQWSVVLYQGKWVGVTNICLALTYLSLGSFYALTEFRMKKCYSVCLILIGMFMMHFEQRHSDVAFGVPVIAFGLFPLIRDWKIRTGNISFHWLRNMSSMIYVIHGIIISVIVAILGKMCFITWLSVLFVCMIVSGVLIELRDKKGFRWLNAIM